jgi:hypothetical protein
MHACETSRRRRKDLIARLSIIAELKDASREHSEPKRTDWSHQIGPFDQSVDQIEGVGSLFVSFSSWADSGTIPTNID